MWKGIFALLEAESEQLMVYTRNTDDASLLVVCNFTGEPQSFARPADFQTAECLLCNYETPSADTFVPTKHRFFTARKRHNGF